MTNNINDLIDAADDYTYPQFLSKLEEIVNFYDPPVEVRIRG